MIGVVRKHIGGIQCTPCREKRSSIPIDGARTVFF